MVFFTDAVPKHFLNYLLIKSGSEQHRRLFKFFIPGSRSWIIMYTCTVSFPAVDLPGMGKNINPHLSFFIRTEVLRDKFKGKYMAYLSSLYESGSLTFSSSCKKLRNSYHWKEFKNKLYEMDWCPYIK